MGLFSRKKNKATEASEAKNNAGAEVAAGAVGPFDIADAPPTERIDFGGLQLPNVEGANIKLELDSNSKQLVGLNVRYKESNIQLHAFAAPKSSGIWESILAGIKETITKQNGVAEEKSGVFGPELYARVPLSQAAQGAVRYAPLRFVGVDGPRWVLRAVITGAALKEAEIAKEIEDYIRQVVVVRGKEAMAPKEVIPLRVAHDSKVESAPVRPKLDITIPEDTIAEVR